MTVYISDEMMPYLYEFNKNGTTILKYNLMKLFDSYHSLRIYELLMRWQNTDHKKVTIELEDLKEKLGVKNKYKLFAEFERNTLTVAKKEINEKSDILMDYKKLALGEAKGKGRKPITHIEFSFKFKQVKEAEELLTDKQIVELTKLCVERVKDTDKAPMALYDWAFAQTKEKVNNKKGFYKYMKAILEGDIAIFLGQLTMNLTPENEPGRRPRISAKNSPRKNGSRPKDGRCGPKNSGKRKSVRPRPVFHKNMKNYRKEKVMQKEFLKTLLENLEDSCFPMQINWGLEELYLKGLDEALEKTFSQMGLRVEKR